MANLGGFSFAFGLRKLSKHFEHNRTLTFCSLSMNVSERGESNNARRVGKESDKSYCERREPEIFNCFPDRRTFSGRNNLCVCFHRGSIADCRKFPVEHCSEKLGLAIFMDPCARFVRNRIANHFCFHVINFIRRITSFVKQQLGLFLTVWFVQVHVLGSGIRWLTFGSLFICRFRTFRTNETVLLHCNQQIGTFCSLYLGSGHISRNFRRCMPTQSNLSFEAFAGQQDPNRLA